MRFSFTNLLSLSLILLGACETARVAEQRPQPTAFKFSDVEKKDPRAVELIAMGRFRRTVAPAPTEKVDLDFVPDLRLWEQDHIIAFNVFNKSQLLGKIQLQAARAGQLAKGESKFTVVVSEAATSTSASQITLHSETGDDFEIEAFDLYLGAHLYHHCLEHLTNGTEKLHGH